MVSDKSSDGSEEQLQMLAATDLDGESGGLKRVHWTWESAGSYSDTNK